MKKYYLILGAALMFFAYGCKKNNQISQASDVSTNATAVSKKGSLAIYQRKNLLLEYPMDTTLGVWFENNMKFPYNARIVKDTMNAGTGSMRVELRKVDSYRAEFGTDARKAPREGWYGFAIYLPANYAKDQYSMESLAQWQAYPDESLGETFRSPALYLGVLNDNFIMDIRTDTARVTPVGGGTFERITIGAAPKGQWNTFVYHVKWASDNTGIMDVWMNNKYVYSRYNKPNCYNDALPPYFKAGIYKWDWAGASRSTTTSRIVYYDEIRIGNAQATLEDVYPGIK